MEDNMAHGMLLDALPPLFWMIIMRSLAIGLQQQTCYSAIVQLDEFYIYVPIFPFHFLYKIECKMH